MVGTRPEEEENVGLKDGKVRTIGPFGLKSVHWTVKIRVQKLTLQGRRSSRRRGKRVETYGFKRKGSP